MEHHDLFISHSSGDAGAVAMVAAVLTAENLDVYHDAKLKEDVDGASFTEEIRQRIQASEILLVLASKRALRSPWVRKEIQAAIDVGKTVWPVCLESTSELATVLDESGESVWRKRWRAASGATMVLAELEGFSERPLEDKLADLARRAVKLAEKTMQLDEMCRSLTQQAARESARRGLISKGHVVERPLLRFIPGASGSARREAMAILGSVGTLDSLESLARTVLSSDQWNDWFTGVEAIKEIASRYEIAGQLAPLLDQPEFDEIRRYVAIASGDTAALRSAESLLKDGIDDQSSWAVAHMLGQYGDVETYKAISELVGQSRYRGIEKALRSARESLEVRLDFAAANERPIHFAAGFDFTGKQVHEALDALGLGMLRIQQSYWTSVNGLEPPRSLPELSNDINQAWGGWRKNPDKKRGGGQTYAASHTDAYGLEWHLPPKQVIAVVGAHLGVEADAVATDGGKARKKLEKAGITIHDMSDPSYCPPLTQLLLMDELPSRAPMRVRLAPLATGKGHQGRYAEALRSAGLPCDVESGPITLEDIGVSLARGEAVLIFPTTPADPDNGR